MRITIVGGEILADGQPVAIIMPGVQPTLRGDLEDWLDGYDPKEVEREQTEVEEDAREEGYNSGYKIGYEEGLEEGSKQGIEYARAARKKGYEEGHREGHAEGYDEGYEVRCADEFDATAEGREQTVHDKGYDEAAEAAEYDRVTGDNQP